MIPPSVRASARQHVRVWHTLSLALWCSSALTLGAATAGLAVEVEPLRLEVTGRPGETLTGSLTLTNPRATPVQVTATTGGYRYSFTAHTTPPADAADRRLPSCEAWVSLRPATLELAPHSTAELAYAVAVPEDAARSPAGEYVAAVLVDERPAGQRAVAPAPAADAGQSTLTIVPRIAIPLYVMLDGRQAPRGRIAALTASAGPAPGTTRLLLTIANDGRTHLRPSGTLIVANDRHEVVWRNGLGRTIPIFPKFQDGIPFLIPLPPGRYTAVATVDLGGPELAQQEAQFTVTADGKVR